MHWCDIRWYHVLVVDTDFQSGLEDRRRTYAGRTSVALDAHDRHLKDRKAAADYPNVKSKTATPLMVLGRAAQLALADSARAKTRSIAD
jgi:hypothetical protein